MPPLEAFGPAIATGLILFVMLWFALGTQRNIRKGNELLRWLQAGLPLLGTRTTLRWLGSSAVELGIVQPAAPFRVATVVVVLEPRDVSVLWAYARSRGRRDFLILRADLARPPRFSADVRDPRGWTGRAGEQAGADDGVASGMHRIEWDQPYVAEAGPGTDDAAIRAAWQRLTEASGGVWRLTVQPVVPHLEVHVRPPDLGMVSADRLVRPFRDLAEALARR